jgi:transcriptional regulator with XRE-family HTH domain
MKSSNDVALDKRLEMLRFSLGLEWGELAQRLDISRSMLGFIRRGDKKPSAKLLYRIASLENEVDENGRIATNGNHVATGEANWQARALTAESELSQLRVAIRNLYKMMEILEST